MTRKDLNVGPVHSGTQRFFISYLTHIMRHIICSISFASCFISARLKTENMIKGTIEHVKHDIADTYRWTESVSPYELGSTRVQTSDLSHFSKIRKFFLFAVQTYRSISVDKEYGRKSSELYEKFSRNICSKQNSRRCFQSS